MRLFRLFRLMDLFRLRSTPITAKSLAMDLGVSVRSVYRDIADLQALGAPIRGEGGVGYVMERGYFLPSLRFEPDELDAIILGLKLVGERAAPFLGGAAGLAAAKISSMLGHAQKDSMTNAALEAGPCRTTREVGDAAAFATLRAAISAREILTIGYRDAAGRPSTREARPLGLTLFEEAWLLTIWCETAQDFRHLRLDRITFVAGVGKRFRSEPGKRFNDALEVERRRRAAQPPHPKGLKTRRGSAEPVSRRGQGPGPTTVGRE